MRAHHDADISAQRRSSSVSSVGGSSVSFGAAAAADDSPDGSLAKQSVSRFMQHLAVLPTDHDYRVSYCELFSAFSSILGRIVGILLTLNVAYEYYRHGRFNYFWWTVACFVVPMVVTTCVQIVIYLQDVGGSKSSRRNPSIGELLCCVVTVPFLFRYCQTLSYAIANKRAERARNVAEQKRYYELLVHEYSDVALIRIFECFLEAAPQKILQIFIILSGEDKASVPQVLSIISSFWSMAWCIASYHRCIRWSQVDKVNISWWGTIMQTMWHFLVSVSRVLSIAIVASRFPLWTMVACGLHAFGMAAWVFVCDRSPFCSTTRLQSLAFSVVLGLVFIFNYIQPRQVSQTRRRYTVFYTICFVENCICVALYAKFFDARCVSEGYVVLLSVLAVNPFILGIVFMCIYYTYFHPNVVQRRQIRAKEVAAAGHNISQPGDDQQGAVPERPLEVTVVSDE